MGGGVWFSIIPICGDPHLIFCLQTSLLLNIEYWVSIWLKNVWKKLLLQKLLKIWSWCHIIFNYFFFNLPLTSRITLVRDPFLILTDPPQPRTIVCVGNQRTIWRWLAVTMWWEHHPLQALEREKRPPHVSGDKARTGTDDELVIIQ